ncbi:hypothetical protein RND81_11G056900 [Saponaria officinalis]|uniref:Uncharacterized protein n=1 Tax=Saponaria officinalis TaxID=3572 RepID=A0AAW1HIC0_SAPOF
MLGEQCYVGLGQLWDLGAEFRKCLHGVLVCIMMYGTIVWFKIGLIWVGYHSNCVGPLSMLEYSLDHVRYLCWTCSRVLCSESITVSKEDSWGCILSLCY